MVYIRMCVFRASAGSSRIQTHTKDVWRSEDESSTEDDSDSSIESDLNDDVDLADVVAAHTRTLTPNSVTKPSPSLKTKPASAATAKRKSATRNGKSKDTPVNKKFRSSVGDGSTLTEHSSAEILVPAVVPSSRSKRSSSSKPPVYTVDSSEEDEED